MERHQLRTNDDNPQLKGYPKVCLCAPLRSTPKRFPQY